VEWWIAGLVISVAYLALALWHIEKRVAALEGLTGNAIQRAIGKWVASMSPRGQCIFAQVVLFGAFFGMAAAFGLMLAAIPFFLYIGGTLSLKWLVIIFLGGTGLYLAISFGAVLYYRVIRGTRAPWESIPQEQEKPS
jgi:hypothetical protein